MFRRFLVRRIKIQKARILAARELVYMLRGAARITVFARVSH